MQHFTNDIQYVDSISVTTHPGLAWSLLVGKTVAQMLGHHYQKPVIGVHHIHGHIFSLLLERSVEELAFPRVLLTASWGHNEIYVVDKKDSELLQSWLLDEYIQAQAEYENHWHGASHHPAQSAGTPEIIMMCDGITLADGTRFSLDDLSVIKLWKTLDDAAGECFDKVARMLWGPYPWGAWIGEKALQWEANPQFRFKRVLLDDHQNPYDFSFSGMKSQVYTLLQRCEREGIEIKWQVLYDIAYEFQEAVVDVLVAKLLAAVQQFWANTVGIVWWVSANDRLFEQANFILQQEVWRSVLRPTKKLYSTDNGAMIGVVGLIMG